MNVKKNKIKNEMKGMRGIENDQNIGEHRKGEWDIASKAYIDYNFKLVKSQNKLLKI